jgi:sugar phosphate isomerase/epimerase
VNGNELHPRVSVSGLCFPTMSAVDAIGAVAGLGVGKTSMTSTKLRESGADAVAGASSRHGVDVLTTTALVRFDLTPGADIEAQVQRAREDIDQAAAVGARSVYTLTGRRVFADWDANVEAYVGIAGELVDYAASKDLVVAVEPTNWLYADLSFVHNFRDALALSSRAGMRVCLDLFHVWTEGTLHHDIVRDVDLVGLVQLSGMTPGSRSLPCRDVPGGGDIPLEEILGWLLDAGYEGDFDLELSGPGIDGIGHREAALRSAFWLGDVLGELGA